MPLFQCVRHARGLAPLLVLTWVIAGCVGDDNFKKIESQKYELQVVLSDPEKFRSPSGALTDAGAALGMPVESVQCAGMVFEPALIVENLASNDAEAAIAALEVPGPNVFETFLGSNTLDAVLMRHNEYYSEAGIIPDAFASKNRSPEEIKEALYKKVQESKGPVLVYLGDASAQLPDRFWEQFTTIRTHNELRKAIDGILCENGEVNVSPLTLVFEPSEIIASGRSTVIPPDGMVEPPAGDVASYQIRLNKYLNQLAETDGNREEALRIVAAVQDMCAGPATPVNVLEANGTTFKPTTIQSILDHQFLVKDMEIDVVRIKVDAGTKLITSIDLKQSMKSK